MLFNRERAVMKDTEIICIWDANGQLRPAYLHAVKDALAKAGLKVVKK